MSHSHSSYLDGVPMQISDKYKGPCVGSLLSNMMLLLKTDEITSPHKDYDFSLENSVTANANQWEKVDAEEAEG